MLKQEPTLYEVHFNLGVLYQILGKKGKAESEYRQAGELNPRSPIVCLNLGVLYLQEGHVERAERSFQDLSVLKPEYAGLTGPQLVELKKQGIQIDNPLEVPIVTYFGDTQYVDFAQLDYVVKSKILIAECTFYEDEHISRASAGRHMHVDEFASLVERLENEHIIISHLTQRTPMREVRKMLKKALPSDIHDKIIILMDRKWRQPQRQGGRRAAPSFVIELS